MSQATAPSGNIDINHGQTDYFTARVPIITASNSRDWTLTLVMRDKPDLLGSTASVAVWWQSGGSCSTGAVSGQTFASASVVVGAALDRQGVTYIVPRTGGNVTHDFTNNDLLCLSINNTGGLLAANDIHFYADTTSTSGAFGVTRLAGPFTIQPSLNLQADGQTMSVGTFPAGTLDINHGQSDHFVSGSPVTSASNASDWNLTLVMRDRPNIATAIDLTVWWQHDNSCGDGPLAGHIFAAGSALVPVPADKQGVTLTIPRTGGTVSHTFVSGDFLCLSTENGYVSGNNDVHAYGATLSTSGVTGFSRLTGPFTN